MFGAMVLRDVPKQEARIDLVRRQIQGGFRGFRLVPPGLHYVSVKAGAHHAGFWCWVKPKEAVVRVFDSEKGFQQDAPDTATHYKELAMSGAMDRALVPYAHERFGPWYGLVRHIDKESFPPPLHEQDPPTGYDSRLDNAFLGTHRGDAQAFLAEFQFAFARWLVSLDAAAEDEVASARWRHLLLAAYNAGEDRIRESGVLFPHLVEALLRQFPLLPDDWFAPGSFLIEQADYLAEDMIDTGVEDLVRKGRAFADYLQTRQR